MASKKSGSFCSFCGKPKEEATMLISGIEANICDACVEQASKIVDVEMGGVSKKKGADSNFNIALPKPSDIKKHLDEYVIGQDQAKKVLSVSVYNHYKRLMNIGDKNEIEIEKSNVLMVGETGTGKTLLVRTLAKILKVPFCIADATVLTEAGYVGEDVESVISRLYQASDYDFDATQRGIVYIDEIDKIARKGDNPSISRDVSGEGVQQGLLKLLEGTIANIAPEGGRKHPDQKFVKIDTRNILFICGGAFNGIDRLIARRLNNSAVGFVTQGKDRITETDLIEQIAPSDLRSFGLIPEIIGRMPMITYLQPLDREALKDILSKPKNAILKQYIKLMELEGVTLDFDKKAIEVIISKAVEFKLGARGLRTICEKLMLDVMYDAPDRKDKNITITADMVVEKLADLDKSKAA
ncbi:MAG: ATP-dependent Clp protease ATP-binding subunit ClpX [Bacteroidetes bacterium]|nr:ATP-dependent Clp protease ATP-binding subunit ClpX [Bacteroidota bacterium]